MWTSPLVFQIAFVSASVFLAAGDTVVTVDVNLKASNAYVDELFISNSMPHMMSKWDRIPFRDKKFRELCKALAPSSVRVLGNPMFHLSEKPKKKKRSKQDSYDTVSKYSKEKFRNAQYKESEKSNTGNFIDDFKDPSGTFFNRVGSVDGKYDPYTSEPVYSDVEKSNHHGPGHEKSNHDGPRHQKTIHDGLGHEKSNLDGPRHEKSNRVGPRHEKSSHDGPKYEKYNHDGLRHEKSDHDGPRYEKSNHVGPRHEKSNHDGPRPEETNHTAHKGSVSTTGALAEKDMSVSKWEKFYEFVQYVGWNISIDFTNIDRRDDGSWDSTAAKAFLKYAAKHNIEIPDFQLGNEPNLYKQKYNISSITPERTVQDYKDLKYLMNGHSLYKHSTLVGPETTKPTSSYSYYIDFMAKGGCNVVDEISFHQYYRNLFTNNPGVNDFLNTSVMDLLELQFTVGREYMSPHNCSKPFRLTESSSISGGLPNVADRFVAGFLWLDKLGVAARSGATRVYRFNIWGSTYSLLDTKTLEPNPDYYLTLLYKRLVEGNVFNVTTDNNNIRAYANCARHLLYPEGSVVIYLLNVLNEPVKLNLKQFRNSNVDTYFFTPGDTTGLIAKTVKVNDILMKLTMGRNVNYQPRPAKGSGILMPAHSFGFIVVPGSKVSSCINETHSLHDRARAILINTSLE